MESLFGSKDQELWASIALGQRGEELAARFLEQNGYRLVVSNFKVPVGRNSRAAEVTGEIDLIAIDAETLCFVEVKTRTSDDLFDPSSAVNLRKQRQIVRTARVYNRIFNTSSVQRRFDVVSIVIPTNAEPRIELLRNFWTEAKFRKRAWNHEYWNDFV
jgi:putative endonuclease